MNNSHFNRSKIIFNQKKIFYESCDWIKKQRPFFTPISQHQYLLLEKQFLSLLSEDNIYQQVLKLRTHDLLSFYHSFDTFILGTLFNSYHQFDNPQYISKGFLLHDIGKLYIPVSLLQKETKLTHEEYDLMKTHTLLGANLLLSLGLDDYICSFAKLHHELLDGSGYPEQRNADSLNISLQTLSIIDAFSAITLKRHYKDSIDVEIAFELLKNDGNIINQEILKSFHLFFKSDIQFPFNIL